MTTEYTSSAPKFYEADGIEVDIQDQFGCQSEYTNKWYESGPSSAIVHRFRLIGHERAEECFAIPVAKDGGRQVFLYLIEGEIVEPKDAATRMHHEREAAERAET